MKIETIQNTYIAAEIVLADRRLKAGEKVQLRCVLDSKLGPVYLAEKLEVDESKTTENDTCCVWSYVLQDKCILPGTYNFEIVIVQGSGLVIPISSKAENVLIIVPAERGECFLKPEHPVIPVPGKKYPTLTLEQKLQMQDLIREYSSVRYVLFYYTGAVRRESYVTPACITNMGYSTDTQFGCVYRFDDPIKDPEDANERTLDRLIFGKEITNNHGKEYYKYMLNCGVYCQMIWMGRPISDFITPGEGKSLTGKDERDILYYVHNKIQAPMHHTLQVPPVNINKKISSVFEINGKPWGYYFDFEISKRAYKAKNGSGSYYTYNSFFKFDTNPIEIAVAEPKDERYTINRQYGKVMAHPLTNQVIVDRRVNLRIDTALAAGEAIIIGKIENYKPDHTTALTVHHATKAFSGYISTTGELTIKCAQDLSTGTCDISVCTTYTSPTQVEPGKTVALGFDGAANMAQELYSMGCEVPYSEIDIGDLVFFRSSDISNDLRNNPNADDDDAMSNKLFRYISHVGVVFDFDDKGYPIISDCTNAYSYPIVIGRTSMDSSDAFSITKASSERNNVVMVARHPAAFGLGGNVPEEFEHYRGVILEEKGLV